MKGRRGQRVLIHSAVKRLAQELLGGHVADGPHGNAGLGEVADVVDSASERILGGTFVGYEAGELIHVILAHMEAGSTWRVLERSVHIHPTFAEGIPSLARLLLA